MLVLSRKVNEKITIGKDIEITILKVQEGSVSLGIRAPKELDILRNELVKKKASNFNKESVLDETPDLL